MRRELSIEMRGARLGRLLVAAVALVAVVGLPANADAEQCPGQRSKNPTITKLGVTHPFTKQIKDIPDLQKRLPELEADLRAVIAQAGLDTAVADAVIESLKSGYGLVDRNLGRGEKVPLQWMAYRCGGKAMVISNPTLNLDQKSQAFELIVEVPDPPPPPPFPGKCEISANRDCAHENPTITIDIDGSTHEPQVTMAADGEAASPLAASGSKWSIPDPSPYCKNYTFTVTAHGDPKPPRYARVFQFLMPKKCGNLALVKELDKKMIEPPGPPPTCTKDSKVEMCKPWCDPSADPNEVEVHDAAQVGMKGGWCDDKAKLTVIGPEHSEPLAVEQAPYSAAYTPLIATVPAVPCFPPYDVRCHVENGAGVVVENSTELAVTPHTWIARGFLFYADPTDGEQRSSTPAGIVGAPSERFEVEPGFGLGASIEKKLNPVVGLEGGMLFGRMNTKYTLEWGSIFPPIDGSDEHPANFYAFTFGVNFHLTKCKAADLYLGPLLGYGGLADPNYWVGGRHFAAKLSGEFVWGGQIGLDIPFNPAKDLGFHAGLKYLVLEQTSDLGDFDVDPLVLEAGLAWKF